MNRSVATPALAALVACLFAVPAHAAGLEVEVGSEINLAGPGLVAVTVHGNVDPAALRVAGIDPVTSGRADVDGDGLTEAVAHFDKERLIGAGALDADTQRLEVTAGTLSGSDAVDVGVTLEVKLARPASAVAALGDLVPLVPRSIDTARLAAKAKSRSGHATPDMGTWYRLTLPASTDVDATIAALRARADVLYAYPAPEAAPPPQFPATPSFLSNQGYLRPAPAGTGADVSLTDPRARGAGIRIADLEYYWTANHEDLQLDPAAADLGKTTFPQYPNFADEHGTAVFGEMVAQGQRLRRHRRRAGREHARHLPDAAKRVWHRHAVRPGRGADVRRAVPLARRRRADRAADPRPGRRHGLRPARVDAVGLRRDEDALEPRDRRRRDGRQRRPGPRLRADDGALRPRRPRLGRDHRRRRQLGRPHRAQLLVARVPRRPAGLGPEHRHHRVQRQPLRRQYPARASTTATAGPSAARRARGRS